MLVEIIPRPSVDRTAGLGPISNLSLMTADVVNTNPKGVRVRVLVAQVPSMSRDGNRESTYHVPENYGIFRYYKM